MKNSNVALGTIACGACERSNHYAITNRRRQSTLCVRAQPVRCRAMHSPDSIRNTKSLFSSLSCCTISSPAAFVVVRVSVDICERHNRTQHITTRSHRSSSIRNNKNEKSDKHVCEPAPSHRRSAIHQQQTPTCYVLPKRTTNLSIGKTNGQTRMLTFQQNRRKTTETAPNVDKQKTTQSI
jgi:hypothetical protein